MLASSYPGVQIFGATPRLGRSIHACVAAVLAAERAKAAVSMEVRLVGPHEMAEISYRTRGQPRCTDVLTFSERSPESRQMNALLFGAPMGESGGPCADDMNDLGSIYMCVPYMWERCRQRPRQNLPFEVYLSTALVHATLHALGYDHTNPAELREMVQREQWLGRRLATLSRRFPSELTAMDGMEYLLAQPKRSHGTIFT